MKALATIVVCTRNRCSSLKRTLESLAALEVQPGLKFEVLVVDNGSSDATPQTVAEYPRRDAITLRYATERRAGQAHARNTGLRLSKGDVIFFVDDDLLVPPDWLLAMTEPFLGGGHDYFAGTIRLAPELERSWMTSKHRSWLCDSTRLSRHERECIGASFGFSRAVLERVPAFDPNLGPGRLGFLDDTLFTLQLAEAGFKRALVSGASAVHHPSVDRLLRRAWLDRARASGRSTAYVAHHWRHESGTGILGRALRSSAAYFCRRARRPSLRPHEEGCPDWEMSQVKYISYLWSRHRLRNEPRLYPRKGLRMLSDLSEDRSP